MIKRVCEEDAKRRRCIYVAQSRRKIKRYIVDGYVCYDTEEFANRKKDKCGRKPKIYD